MNVLETYLSSTSDYFNWFIGQATIESGSLYGNYFWFLAIISIVFFILEIVIPWRKNQPIFRKDFWLDFFYMYFNFFLFYLALFAGLGDFFSSFFSRTAHFLNIDQFTISIIKWPIWIQFGLMLVIQDFTHWNIHRLLHKTPFLWRFHKVHHSVKQMGFAAHLRFHWMESIIYKSITFIPLFFIGFGIEDFFYLHVFTITWGHFNHANINIPLGPLKYVFNSPQMHIWHHVKTLPTTHQDGVNFGLTLSIWDYIFNTKFIPCDGEKIELGFKKDELYPKGFVGQIVDAFIRK